MSPGSERWFRVAYGLWLFGIFAYFMPAATWNPVSRFDLTRAIVEEHTLSIDEFANDTGDRARFRDSWHTDKAPIPSLLAVPIYAAIHASDRLRGKRPAYTSFATQDLPAARVLVNGSFQRSLYACSLATAGLGTAIAGVLLFELLRRRFSPEASLIGSAATVLGTPLFPYATSFYGHAVAGFFLVAALFVLALDGDRVSSRSRVRLGGACLALAAGSEYITAVPSLAIITFAVLGATRGSRLRAAIDLATGALVPVMVVAAYHAVCFGAPWRTGYSFIQRAEFARGHASGLLGVHLPSGAALYGILVGGRRGLFLLSPIAALAVPSMILDAAKKRDAAVRAALVAFVLLVLANAGYYMWWGGAATGPRHLVPVIGFLAFGVAWAWERPRLRTLVVVLGIVSFANMLVLTAVGLEGPEHGNLLFDYGYRRFLRGDIASIPGASNLALRLGLVRAGSLGPLLVWVLLGGRYLFRGVTGETNADEAPADEAVSPASRATNSAANP